MGVRGGTRSIGSSATCDDVVARLWVARGVTAETAGAGEGERRGSGRIGSGRHASYLFVARVGGGADGRAGEARAGRGRAERGRGARERLRGEGEGAHRVSAFGTGR